MQYAFGILDPKDEEVIEARLRAGDAEAIRLVMEYRTLLSLLPHALPQHRPAAALRARLLATLDAPTRVSTNRPSPTRRPQTTWFRTPWVWMPAAAMVIVVQGWLIVSSLRHVDHVAVKSHTILNRASEHEWFLNDFKILAMTGTDHAPHAGAMVFWDTRQHRCTLLFHNLPSLGPHEWYQLWFVVRGSAIRSEAFAPAASGPTMLQVPLLVDKSSVESAAVTVEATSDMPQPAGKTILRGQF